MARHQITEQQHFPLKKQVRNAGLFIKFILQVEEALPGATGKEKKQWVRRKLDDLIVLPPIAEEISDIIIAIGTEIGYAGVRAIEQNEKLMVIERAEYDKMKADYADLYARWESLQ
jgi:hypothetical protein